MRLLLLGAFAVSLANVFACYSGGSGMDEQAPLRTSAYISGVYEFTIESAISSCSDGSGSSKGFGFSAELSQKGPLPEAKNGANTFGRGDISPEGKFHMSGVIGAEGVSITFSLDGQTDGENLSGTSKAGWIMPGGLACTHASVFKAKRTKKG